MSAEAGGNKQKSGLGIVRYAGTIIVVVSIVVAYEIATDVTGVLDRAFFPGLISVSEAMLESLPQLIEGFFSTMRILLPGFFLAAALAVVSGSLIALHPAVHRNARPLIFALSALPPSILTPYLIVVMPSFYGASVAVIFIGAFWPILAGTIDGIISVKQDYLDNAAVLGMTGTTRFFEVILPAAASHILAGFNMALTFSFILLVIAETMATKSGLGYFVQYYADFMNYARVISGLLFMMLVVVLIRLLFLAIQRRILFWESNELSE